MNEFIHKLNIIKSFAPKMEFKSSSMVVENQIDIFTNQMLNNNNNVIWTNMVMPTEMFYAFGLIPVHMELIAGWFATLGLSEKYIQYAHKCGYAVNLCSYHKAVIGALELGIISPPRIAVISSHICDGGSLMARYFQNRFGTEIKVVDVPFYKTDENVGYVYKQLLEVREFLEKYMGKRPDEGKLKNAAELSDTARNYILKVNEHRKQNTLFRGNLAIRNMFGASFLLGSEKGVDVFKTYEEELSCMSPINNTYRILWIHFAPLFAASIMKYFEEDLKLYIAFDITSHVYWNAYGERDILTAMADKLLSHFYLGSVRGRINMYVNIIREFKIDGIVMYMHNGCRAIPCSSWELRNISKQEDIPFLELSGDCIDPNGFSYAQTYLRMEAFRESLGSKLEK